jgi:hypothetical protein
MTFFPKYFPPELKFWFLQNDIIYSRYRRHEILNYVCVFISLWLGYMDAILPKNSKLKYSMKWNEKKIIPHCGEIELILILYMIERCCVNTVLLYF